MAILEPDRHAFEAKAQLGGQDHLVDMDVEPHGVPLQNGHNFKDSLESHSSINTSAHQSNLEIDTHDFAPTTNGFSHSDDHHVNDTHSSFGQSSDLPNSGDTMDSHLPSSSQSAPEDVNDQTASKLDDIPAPAIVQQPTSDVRDEAQPTSAELTAETKEESDLQKHSELASATMSDESPQAHKPESSDLPNAPEAQPPVTSSETASNLSQQPASIPAVETPDHPPAPTSATVSEEAPLDPVPSPAPAATTSAPEQSLEASNDQPMQDAPASPSKVARERENDDSVDERATKRPKTDNDQSSDFKVPERPTIDTKVSDEPAHSVASEPQQRLTVPQHKAVNRVLSNVKRIQASIPFRQPVDVVALKIPTYFDYIKKPMDLKTLEENFKGGKYSSPDEFRADFEQIIENARIFNGPEHTITKSAYSMKANFDKAMENMPGPDVAEPEKKKKINQLPPAPKPSAPRRESRSSLPGAARSPGSTASTPTFALGPQGVPLIRRDSTVGDGRPKREIHPPAPRDLPYANQKPKKKKYMYELKFCEKVLSELSKPKYGRLMWPFSTPVDPVALNIPTYHSVIKKPMDFGTMKQKLDHGEYENAKEFEADAKQVFQNCYKFNRPGDDIYRTGQELESIFDSEWSRKRDWIEANTPASGAQSPGSSDVEDSDEDEEEEDDEDEAAAQLSKLQQQIAQMSKQVEMITQKKKSPPASNKKAAKGTKAPRKETKKAAAPARVEKKAASKPAKKTPYVTYEMKQDISHRINNLTPAKMAAALNIIRSHMPNLRGVQDDELELDIDELSDEVLHKLYTFVRKNVPRPDDEPTPATTAAPTAAPSRKKNKPMSKHEQEARIAQVQSGLNAFQNPGSAPTYEEPGPDQESSDGGESSESEEE